MNDDTTVEEADTNIEWGYNCLTSWVHHGRPEEIWNLPAGYAVQIYGRIVLEELIVARIYNDAMQMVEHNDKYDEAWAERIKELAHERFSDVLENKIEELNKYYTSQSWIRDIQGVVGLVKKNKLNPGYAPLHNHDSINLLCRIIGVSAEQSASREKQKVEAKELESGGKSNAEIAESMGIDEWVVRQILHPKHTR